MIINTNKQDAGNHSNAKGAKVSFAGMGKKDAEQIANALNKAVGSLREKLMVRAPELTKPQDLTDWLEGFGKVMGKTKKSEAKAVIIAFSIDSEKVKNTKGDYNEWIKACREIIKAQKAGEDGDGEPVAPKANNRKVTDKQHAAILTMLARSTLPQLERILNTVCGQLVTIAPDKDGNRWESVAVRHVGTLAQTLKLSEEPLCQNLSQVLYDLLEQASQRQANAENNVYEGEKVNYPVPLDEQAVASM